MSCRQQRRARTGTRFSHEGSHFTRHHVARDAAEQPPRFSFDGDVVVDVPPGEDVGRGTESVGSLVLLLFGSFLKGCGVLGLILLVAFDSGTFDRVDKFSRSVSSLEQDDAPRLSLVDLPLCSDECDREEEDIVGPNESETVFFDFFSPLAILKEGW